MQKKHSLSDLPVELELEKTDASFPSLTSNILLLTQLVGFIIVATGVLTMIFGPDSVWVNRQTGMTFLQFIQLYPGPIASIGALILFVPELYKKDRHAKQQAAFLKSLEEQLDFTEQDLPEGKVLDLTLVRHSRNKDLYRLNVVDAPAPQQA